MCFLAYVLAERARTFISGIQADRFFFSTEETKKKNDSFGVNVSSWLVLQLHFICQFHCNLFVCICTMCVYIYRFLLLLTNRLADDFMPTNLCNFSNRKPVIDFPHSFISVLFLIWTFGGLNTLQIRHIGCIICRLHFKWFVEKSSCNSTAFKSNLKCLYLSGLCIDKWMNNRSRPFDMNISWATMAKQKNTCEFLSLHHHRWTSIDNNQNKKN